METTRELYRQKYEAQLHEWGAKLEAMEAHVDKLTADAKLDAKPRLAALHREADALKARLADIARATDEGWEDVKQGADRAWDDAKGALEGAYDTLVSRKGR